MVVTYQQARESSEYTQGLVEYFRGGSEVANEEGYVTHTRIDSTDFVVIVKEGRTVRVPMGRVLRIRLQQ